MSSLSLAQQLKQLHSSNTDIVDPESAYTSLDSHKSALDGDEGREHYLNVGPSRLRMELGGTGGGTLTGPKYEGVKTGRVKIFDDDQEESEEEVTNEGSDGEGEEDDVEEKYDEEDDEHDEEEGEEDDEEEDGQESADEEQPVLKTSQRALDPVASLRTSRLKDVEKGQDIRRQKSLFESLITLRITYQKALTASGALPITLPADPESQIASKKTEVLRGLRDLSDRLFTLREGIQLPGNEVEEAGLGKRKRAEGELEGSNYWLETAEQSLRLADQSHPHILPILNKWSSKIQAASLQLGSKQAGSSKFLKQIKTGSGGVVEAIETGLTSRRDAEKSLMETEEAGYRALLREVIESRSGSGPAVDLSHLRKEKKKKREADRGGSKGRKLRYTVHEKAQNFVVPIPLSHGWHEEQVDELFSSLFGGAGMKGATSETLVGPDVGDAEEGLAELNGLRVF